MLCIQICVEDVSVRKERIERMACRWECDKYKAKKPLARIRRYAVGQKYCNTCMIFLEWDGLYCPCCHYRLRESPRNSKVKQAYRKENKNV